jgi:predicted RNA-binding protein with RPS1 domain
MHPKKRQQSVRSDKAKPEQKATKKTNTPHQKNTDFSYKLTRLRKQGPIQPTILLRLLIALVSKE